jgi:ATP-dependent exoDNAse (exonuclease V) alpha subunit
MRGTVIAVDPTEKEVIIRTDAGAHRALDAAYVTEHLQHAYALTAHTIQGGTVEWAGVVGHPNDFTRNWSYTALSRAREATEIFLIDTPTEHQLTRAEIAPNHAPELGDPRTPLERLDAAMRMRDDEDLALDRIDRSPAPTVGDRDLAASTQLASVEPGRISVDELRTALAQVRQGIGHYPEHLADQLHAARTSCTDAQRAADEARARIADLEHRAGGMLRRHRTSGNDAELAIERERLKLAERHAAAAAEHERGVASQVPDRTTWERERRALRERAAALETQLSLYRQEYVRHALDHPAPYLVAELGPLPDEPRARRTWEQAAQTIEALRFDHAITDTRTALGPAPTATQARAERQRAQRDVQHAQRDLGRRNDRSVSREL